MSWTRRRSSVYARSPSRMAIFATTSWTVIARTREPGEEARRATAELCRGYWQALYAFARRSGQAAHQAEDTVQGFLVHVVEEDVFAQADAERGRFRTFLIAALRQYMARSHRDQTRQKRAPGEGKRLVVMDFELAESMHGGSTAATPDGAFDRAWALAQLDMVWQRLEAESAEAGKAAVVSKLRPVVSGRATTPSKQLAEELGMTEGAVNVAAHRLRRRFGEVLREVIAETLESPGEVDDELGRLLKALAARSA